ncbi:hypothetical protein H5410_055443 [Solanum commersonii]|uniref:Uncharacterized protein n=1 Tax=Solanum commersonii TaxID=4109 RepID=A0A9J5WIQ5_SOLCO|nr:hypothetical protein H5410_055443 [Solanum commersonii]
MGVASDWCFPSPLLKQAMEKNMKKKSHKNGPEPGPDYLSDLETVSMVISSSFSSHESWPRRPVSNADWVVFSLL